MMSAAGMKRRLLSALSIYVSVSDSASFCKEQSALSVHQTRSISKHYLAPDRNQRQCATQFVPLQYSGILVDPPPLVTVCKYVGEDGPSVIAATVPA